MAPITILKKTDYSFPESLVRFSMFSPIQQVLQLADAPEWFIDIISVRVTNVHAPHIRSEEIPGIDRIFLGKRDHERWFHCAYNKDKTPLENLQSQFYDGDDYGISLHWIEHIFKLTHEDFEVAKAVMKWDILYRVLIQRLHFDLHWFTTRGAFDFVKDLIWEVTASDTILKSAALEIPLLTGESSHTYRKVSEIQRMLLLHFDGHIRKHDSNPGILILRFEKLCILTLDLADFLNGLDPLGVDGEVEHNRDNVDHSMDSKDLDTDSIASNGLELDDEKEPQHQEEEEDDEEVQEVGEKENKEHMLLFSVWHAQSFLYNSRPRLTHGIA
ncbi:hypothetical protein B9Z55_028134 [Caenorhabditis nigoni]|uniref:Uncharacterized protein n=1 Tax=Caenorhabditis nigoni TaxID=1611254 RepID=A0A2G5SCT8_9PELO|nr:hypothetical protein B9Z55_028134 [Caenorhabditis nigoni]